MLVLDVWPPRSPDNRPRAEPEKDGKIIFAAKLRERRLQSQQLRLKEGGILLLRMRH